MRRPRKQVGALTAPREPPRAPRRFHEKEGLRRVVRAAADRPGVLYAFIVLDNPANSILDMQVRGHGIVLGRVGAAN